MIQNEGNIEESVLPFLIHPLTDARGQVHFCRNLIANLFEKRDIPYTREFPDEKIKRQLLDHYLKSICSLTSQSGIYTVEIKSSNAFHDKNLFKLMT